MKVTDLVQLRLLVVPLELIEGLELPCTEQTRHRRGVRELELGLGRGRSRCRGLGLDLRCKRHQRRRGILSECSLSERNLGGREHTTTAGGPATES